MLKTAPQLALLAAAYVARAPLHSCWDLYCTVLEDQPLPTKIITGIVCGAIGDLIAQVLSYDAATKAQLPHVPTQPFSYDLPRMFRLVMFGVVLGTPWGHVWFEFLDKNIMPEAMTSPAAVLVKMALDQFVSAPAMTAVYFLYSRCAEGRPGDAWPYMSERMRPTMMANWMLWPAAHIVNFAFVPPQQRILFCNVVSLLWTVVLSGITNSANPAPPPASTCVEDKQQTGP